MSIDEVPKPTPGNDEVLIRVRAASVNPVDYKMRTGEFKGPGTRVPFTLGRDVSGVVEAVGRNVDHVSVGTEVYALLAMDHGGYAEYAVAPGKGTAPKPTTLDHVTAAAVPLAATTAWQGLFDYGQLKAGERVLIHGAAGGVGHFAVQFAKNCGAYVVATARDEDRAALEKLGANEVIDYRAESFEDRVHDLDLVLDLVAGDVQARSWNVVREGGRIISTLQPPSAKEAVRHHAQGKSFMAVPNREQLTEIARMIDDGRVSVLVQKTLPLAQARQAHEHLEHDHVRGKVVLTVAG